MKIDLDKSSIDQQQIRKLRQILTDCHADNTLADIRPLLEVFIKQIDSLLADRETEPVEPGSSIPDYLSSFWNFLSGPSHRELELSKQRKELIERAEHAENSAFEALAESSDLKRENEQARQRIRELEQEIANLRASGKST